MNRICGYFETNFTNGDFMMSIGTMLCYSWCIEGKKHILRRILCFRSVLGIKERASFWQEVRSWIKIEDEGWIENNSLGFGNNVIKVIGRKI